MNKLAAYIVGAVIGLIVLMGISMCARADTWMAVTVTSYHSDNETSKTSTGKHNAENFGLGFEHDVDWFEHSRLVGGFYKNSFYNDSIYVGITVLPWKIGPARIGAMFGLVTGYDERSIMPTILPTISFEGKTFGANVGLLPTWSEGHSGVIVGLQVKMKIR
jgi:hypothetical protein